VNSNVDQYSYACEYLCTRRYLCMYDGSHSFCYTTVQSLSNPDATVALRHQLMEHLAIPRCQTPRHDLQPVRCRSLAPRVPLLPWRSSRRAQEAPSSQWRTFFVWTLRAKRGGWSRSGGMPTCTALRRMSIRSLLGDWYSMFRSAQSTITTWMETSTHSKVKRLRRQRSIAA
jgi:hypothetical protein